MSSSRASGDPQLFKNISNDYYSDMKTAGGCGDHKDIIVLDLYTEYYKHSSLICHDIKEIISSFRYFHSTSNITITHHVSSSKITALDFILIAQSYIEYNQLVERAPTDPLLEYINVETNERFYGQKIQCFNLYIEIMLHDAVTKYTTPDCMERFGSGLFHKIFSYTTSNGALKHLKILYESLLLNPDDVKKNIASLNSTYKIWDNTYDTAAITNELDKLISVCRNIDLNSYTGVMAEFHTRR